MAQVKSIMNFVPNALIWIFVEIWTEMLQHMELHNRTCRALRKKVVENVGAFCKFSSEQLVLFERRYEYLMITIVFWMFAVWTGNNKTSFWGLYLSHSTI